MLLQGVADPGFDIFGAALSRFDRPMIPRSIGLLTLKAEKLEADGWSYTKSSNDLADKRL
jgi:homoserine kinase